MIQKRTIGILVFDDAEVLDFAGPFEVFSVSSQLNEHKLFKVFIVAETLKPIKAKNGLSINPDYSIDNCPPIDILVIAGGDGTNQQIKNKPILDWISTTHPNTAYTLSICSGSRLLGVLGLLDNQPYCTHHQVYDDMEKLVPTGIPKKEKRFVEAGKIFTSGGISAGIDLSFHLVEKLFGKKIAKNTAKYMEYRTT